MNKELRNTAYINVKNYVSQRQKNLRFLALSTDKPRDDRDLVGQVCNGPLSPGFPRLTPVRCERIDFNLPVDVVYLSEDTIWDFIRTHDWSTGSSLRVCEGHLLQRILKTLKDLTEGGYINMQTSARFDTCCFPKNPTAIRFLNLYEKDMIPETVKITFSSYAINPKQPSNFLINIQKKLMKKKIMNETISETDKIKSTDRLSNVSSGPNSVPQDFIFAESNNGKLKTESQSTEKTSQFAPHSSNTSIQADTDTVQSRNPMGKTDLKDAQENESVKHSMETIEVPSTVSSVVTQKESESSQKNKLYCQSNKLDCETKEGGLMKESCSNQNTSRSSSAQSSVVSQGEHFQHQSDTCNNKPTNSHRRKGKKSDGDVASKTRSETVMSSRQKQRRVTSDRRTLKGSKGPLELDQFGKPKFAPSFETVVDEANFKFNRCDPDSDDDNDCDRTLWKQRKPPNKLIVEKDSSKAGQVKPRAAGETYWSSDSELDEPQWLNGVPPAPVRTDVKSIEDYFKIRRKLKYGNDLKKIIFLKDSDYFPQRLYSRATNNNASIDSTHGMSYFNSQYTTSKLPTVSSDQSLPASPPSSLPTTTEMNIHKTSHEAVCGSHGKFCHMSTLKDEPEERESDDGDLAPGTIGLMNITLLNRIKPNYSTDRLAEMVEAKTGKTTTVRPNAVRRFKRIIKSTTATFNEYAGKIIFNSLRTPLNELKRAQLPAILRAPPTASDQKMWAKPDPNRPIDAMYKNTKPGAQNLNDQFSIPCSPDTNPPPVPGFFKPDERLDCRPHILQAVQEFVIVKETVTRPAGRGTIVSLTITKPKRYKFGTAKQICEENGFYYEHATKAPYPTPKCSQEPL